MLGNLLGRLRKKKSLVNGVLFSIFSFFNQGIGFLLLIILAKFIVPDKYGQLSLFNTLATFLGYFIALSTQGYISVAYFQKDRKNFKNDFSSILFITFSMSILFLGLFVAFKNRLIEWLNLPFSFIALAIPIALLTIIFRMLLDYYRVKEEVKVYGVFSCGYALVNFVVSLLLVITFSYGWQGRVYSHFWCILLFGIIGIVIFFKEKLIVWDVNWSTIKPILLWGIPLIPHLCSNWLRQGADRIIVNNYHSLNDVGIFSFALNLLSMVVIIGSAFNSSNSVTIYQILSSSQENKEKRFLLRKQTRDLFLVYLCATLLIVIGATIFVPILLPKYASSVHYFWILSIAGYFQCLYFLFCNYLFYYNRTKDLMMITFLCSAFHFVMSLLITRYSLYYTCCVYVLSYLLILILVMKKARKIIKTELPI